MATVTKVTSTLQSFFYNIKASPRGDRRTSAGASKMLLCTCGWRHLGWEAGAGARAHVGCCRPGRITGVVEGANGETGSISLPPENRKHLNLSLCFSQ